MTTKKETKICKICDLPIHEENLYQVNGYDTHFMCWEQLVEQTTNMRNKDLKKEESEIIRKANAISTVIRNVIWIGIVIMIIKIIMNLL